MQRFFTSFGRDESGNVIMMAALGIMFLIGVAGAGVDLGRQQLVKAKLQQASDAAALAAAGMPQGTAENDRRTMANRYFNLNFPQTYIGVTRPTPTVTISAGSVRVSGSQNVPTKFMKVVGNETMVGAAGSSVLIAQAGAQTYDVLLVMDNSGSMAYRDIGAGGAYREIPSSPSSLRTNARNDADNNCAAWYVAQGSFNNLNSARDFCNDRYEIGYWDRSDNDPYGYGLTDPVRLNAVRLAARTITTELLNPNEAGNRVGTVTWNHGLLRSQALTTNFNTVAGEIDRMFAFGATNSLVGMQRAQTLAANFDNTHIRAIVLLTDGMNTWGFPGCTGGSDSHCTATDTATNNVCTTLKGQGIVIYTVAFGTDVTTGPQATAAQNFLRNCASLDANNNARFYVAPNSSVLQQTFGDILTSIQKLRIAE